MRDQRDLKTAPAACPSPGFQDPVWTTILGETEAALAAEPHMAAHFDETVLRHTGFDEALVRYVAQRLGTAALPAESLATMFAAIIVADCGLGAAARADLRAVVERDPATRRFLQPFLYYKGFLALAAHRLAHAFWRQGDVEIAAFLQMRSTECFGVDIHPAARIGPGLMMDHAHGIVIGETAEIGSDVTLLHAVTLGATGKTAGDRHPKVGDRVVIGAAAIVLGNIRIGDGARIAAGSVVVRPVPAGATVAGNPARIVNRYLTGFVDGCGI